MSLLRLALPIHVGVVGGNQRVCHVAAFIHAHGYPGVVSLLMLGIIGLPVPSEWLLVLGGNQIFKGYLHIVPTLVVEMDSRHVA